MDLLQKIFGLATLVRPGSFTLCYTDTDSFVMAVGGSGLAGLVKKEHQKEWEVFHKNNFVTDKQTSKKLGLLKVENHVDGSDGHFCCVGPKLYIFDGKSEKNIKIAGLNNKIGINRESFLQAIYEKKHTNIWQVRKNVADQYLSKKHVKLLSNVKKSNYNME